MNNILERMQKERNIEMKTEEVEENKISENNLIVTNIPKPAIIKILNLSGLVLKTFNLNENQ